MANSADPDQLASSEASIWIYTVCKGRVYLVSAGQGLMTNSSDTDQLASSEASSSGSVCKGRACLGSVGLGLNFECLPVISFDLQMVTRIYGQQISVKAEGNGTFLASQKLCQLIRVTYAAHSPARR